MVKQLALGLSLRDDATFSNFYPGDNAPLIAYLQTFAQAPGEQLVFLWGSAGVGRTHLLQASCHLLDPGQAVYLDLAESALQPAVLLDLEYFSLICLDNIDAVLGRDEWELALFNFYNRCREHGSRLLISALAPPAQLRCQLADLRSRLAWGVVLNLQPLADDQKLSALQMRAKRRGLELTQEVGVFLLHHYPREMSNLFSALETLDRESLSAKHRLTIPFIKQVLSTLRHGGS